MLQKINQETRLYVIKEAHGFSCLGFDVLERRGNRLAKELGVQIDFTKLHHGEDKYEQFSKLQELAHKRFIETGYRCECELHPEFLPFLNTKVRAVFADGTNEIFRVGRSTGYIPCLLRIDNDRSMSGEAIDIEEKVLSIRKLY